ncbi:MAG: glutathione synthase [Gammaproteobacteria bacterium]
MKIKLGVIMDPLTTINVKKDSTLAMLEEAQQRGWTVFYMQPQDIFIEDGVCMASMHGLIVDLKHHPWFTLQEPIIQPLAELNVVLMRKDPPFDMEYIYTTYLLELAETAGVLVINKPQSLRDANEKIFTCQFPQCCPPSLVSKNMQQLRGFVEKHRDVIVKPLGGMGGYRIFRIRPEDSNLSVILETMTEYGQQFCMAQRFIPEIIYGDKRVIVIDGEPVPFALARIPKTGEIRGNLAAGARAEVIPLSERERWICAQVAPTLREKGLMFVGLDIIGDYLTEINVTSPTCIREIEAASDVKISRMLFDKINLKLT